tara:strand:+ start:1338 stop:1532 length:195 start_codon:yes stop_codon:yes gene_type:complete
MRDVIRRGPKTPRDTSLFIKYTLATIGISPLEVNSMHYEDVLDLFYLHLNVKQMEAEEMTKGLK